MSKRKISFGVLIGGISLAIDSISALIIYPLLLKFCTQEIAGLWIFYTSFTIIISLGQAGLAPVIMRRAAEAKITGVSNEMAEFLSLVRKSYKIVTAIVFLICILLYFGYIHWVLIKNPEIYSRGLAAWILFMAGNTLRMYYIKNLHVINGLGEVGWDKVSQIVVSIFTVLGYFLVLRMGGDLVGLSLIFFLASIFYSGGSVILLNKFVPNTSWHLKVKVPNSQTKALFLNGGKILVLNIVGILVLNKDIYLVERFQGLAILPLFSALNRIQTLIMAVSLMIPQMIFPFVAQSFALSDYKKTFQLYWIGVILSVATALFLSVIIYSTAGLVIPLWLGEGNYLGDTVLLLLLIFGLLVIHHNSHASAILATGANYFIWPAIINALMSVPFAIIGIKYWGLSGMIIGNIVATVIPSAYVVAYSIRYFNKRVKVIHE